MLLSPPPLTPLQCFTLLLLPLLPATAHNIFLPSNRAPTCSMPDPSLFHRPVIGILSHPGDGASGRLSNATGDSNIPASYVKFVESGGARVVPIIYNEPLEVIYDKLNLVNGVIFTGGWAKSGLYYDVAKKVFQKVLERNDAGDHFPLFAICLGFELLSMIITKDPNILEKFDASAQASSLQFTTSEYDGTVFQRFPKVLLEKMSEDCLVMQNHHYGVSPKRWYENEALPNFFELLTTSIDASNKVYVSTVQARKYPITAFQWHPEKNAFEWGIPTIPHSEDAVHVTQHTANYLISEARKSSNRPPLREVLDNLIYKYPPTYCGKAGKGYDEVYIFTKASTPAVLSVRHSTTGRGHL